jgi:SAM-dependent methyltransferase
MVKLALNRTLSSRNDWDHSAGEYAAFAAEKNLYKESAGALVRFAGIEPGMTVVDLGCGPGAVIETLLDHPHGGDIRIIGVDFSPEMLAFARSRITAPNVELLCEKAENLARAVKTKVDRVLCNAAFWHFDKEKTFSAINRILGPSGRCLIGLPVHDFRIFDINKLYDQHKVIWMILEEKALRGHRKKNLADFKMNYDLAQDKNDISGYLSNLNLKISSIETVIITLSNKDHLDFLRIPIMVKNSYFFHGVPQEEVQDILNVVERQLEWVDAPATTLSWLVYIIEGDR